jgi:DNA-binding HxlR family transcriptional regulator
MGREAMVGTRSYGQACPVAHALDMVGERWALLIVRELRLGPRRYVDLQANLPGIGPSVLAQRLRDLEAVGVLRRRTLPMGTRVYELTEWGGELEPVFTALATWGVRSPVPLTGVLTADPAMLGLRTFFGEGRRPPWTATYHVRLEGDSYVVRVVDGRLVELARDEPRGPVDATVETTPATFNRVWTGAEAIDDAIGEGRLSVHGDERAVRRLLAPTALPEAAE